MSGIGRNVDTVLQQLGSDRKRRMIAVTSASGNA
jgi:hypothetical protein